MRILLTGADGQLGQAISAFLAPHHTLLRTSSATIDISAYRSVTQVIDARPDLVIHSAAFTNVDGCALDPDRAYAVNGLGTRHMALACQGLNIPLVYISTNEVFDGAATAPYHEWDRPQPINPYAYSKWAGEQFVQQLLQKFYIVRIAWVFGGARNFVRTMLRLADERPLLSVVHDEIGNPTYASDVAAAIGALINEPSYGIYHFVNDGYCSRFDFAREILRLAGKTAAVEPITLADYHRASTPPPFTPLRNFVGATDLGIVLRPWQLALEAYLAALLRTGTA